MVREIQVNVAKNIPTQFVAKANMVTGMGAQIDLANGQAILPTAATGANIYMVEREREVTGLKASLTDIDDYDVDFVTVKANNPVKLIPMYNGERYAVDQYDAGLIEEDNIGKPIVVGTDGKWELAASGSSRFVYGGAYQDGTHVLAIVCVVDTEVAYSAG